MGNACSPKLKEFKPINKIIVAAAINGLGLDYLGPFSAKERIIEWALRTEESE